MNGCLDDGQVNEQTNFDQLPCVLQVTSFRERGIDGNSKHSPEKQSRSMLRGREGGKYSLVVARAYILEGLTRKYSRKSLVAKAGCRLPGVQVNDRQSTVKNFK
jgi:hypothetical protein